MDVANKISEHYTMGQQPDNIEMIGIVAEAMKIYPKEYSEKRKSEMLDVSIRLAKELFSKVRFVVMDNIGEDGNEAE